MSIPEHENARIETYLAKICGKEVQLTEPRSRLERFYAKWAGMNVELPTGKYTLEERWLLAAMGEGEVPEQDGGRFGAYVKWWLGMGDEPDENRTRLERYWRQYGYNTINLFDEDSPFNMLYASSILDGNFPAVSANRPVPGGTYFFAVKPNTKYKVTTVSAGSRFGLYGFNQVITSDMLSAAILEREAIIASSVFYNSSGVEIPLSKEFTTGNSTKFASFYYGTGTLATGIEIHQVE